MDSIYADAVKEENLAEVSAGSGDVLYRSGHVAISVGGTTGIEAPQPGTVVSYSSGSWTCALKF